MNLAIVRLFFAYLAFAALLASAVLLTALRFWLLPQANHYKPEIEAQLSAIIHEPLLVGKVSAAMRGINPQLILWDCNLPNSDGAPSTLNAQRVEVTIDSVASLLTQKIRFAGVVIDDIHLTVHRRADGSLGLLGLSGKTESPVWLSTIRYLQLRHSTIGWLNDRSEMPMRQDIGLADAEFRTLDREHHQLALRFDSTDDSGQSLDFRVQQQGDLFDPSVQQGRFYVEGARIPADLLRVVELPGIKIQSGEADFKIWGDFKQDRLEWLAGKMALRHPLATYNSHIIQFDRLSSIVNWRRFDGRTELQINKLNFAATENQQVNNRLAMRIGWNAAGGLDELGANIKTLQIDEITRLAIAFPEGDQISSLITHLAPVGEIHELRAFYAAPGAIWSFCGGFSDLSFNSEGKIPGVKRLQGSVCGTDREGMLKLAMQEGEIFGEQLWLKALPIKSLNATIDWRHDPQGVLLSGQNVNLQYKDTAINLDFDFVEPADPAQLPVLDLTGRTGDFPAENLVEILPVFAMDKNAAAWLKGAFISGRFNGAVFLFRGAFEQFPFTGNEGIFELEVRASQLQLHYDPNWPDLFDVEGRLTLKNGSYLAEIEQGRVDQFPLKAVQLNAPDYIHHPWVYLDGGFSGDFSSILKALEHTPEKPLVDRLNWFGRFAGKVGFDLKMRLPLDIGIGDGEVDGKLTLENVTMDIQQAGHAWGKLSQLNGAIRFSGTDIAASDIKGRLFGEPLTIGLDHKDGRVILTAQGRLQVSELSKYFPHDVWSSIGGESAYSLNLTFPAAVAAPNTDNDIKLKVQSDLVGIESRLPYPLDKIKTAEQTADLEWEMFSDQQSVLRVDYGKNVKARFNTAERNRSYDVMLGAQSLPAQSAQPNKRVYVDLTEFDLTPWMNFLSGTAVAGADMSDYLPNSVSINLGKLTWQGKNLGALQFNAERKRNDWSGWFDSGYGKGSFQYADDDLGPGILDLNLDAILLGSSDSDSGGESLDPALLPTLKVHSRKVEWRGHNLGELQLNAEHWMHGLNISAVKLTSPYSNLQLRGSWMKHGEATETRVVGSLASNSLGAMLENLGYVKDVRDTPAKSTFSFVWEGGPHQFSAAKLFGDMGFKLGRGGLLNVDPGLGRAALLLNLDTLRRLLILDFNDLFGQGLAYDSISGSYHFEKGQADARKMLIDAVVAEIAIRGSIDLVKHQLDQRIDVMPHAMAVLPFVGALVPGVVISTAVNMADSLVGQEQANLASNHYVIKGSWDKPQVYRVQGNLPLDMLDRAWTDLKEISGFGQQEEE